MRKIFINLFISFYWLKCFIFNHYVTLIKVFTFLLLWLFNNTRRWLNFMIQWNLVYFKHSIYKITIFFKFYTTYTHYFRVYLHHIHIWFCYIIYIIFRNLNFNIEYKTVHNILSIILSLDFVINRLLQVMIRSNPLTIT